MSKALIVELRQKRAKAIADARALNDQVQKEARDFTPEEQQTWDKYMNEASTLQQRYEREERLDQIESDLNDSDYAEREQRRMQPAGQDSGQPVEPRSRPEYRDAFRSYLANGMGGISPNERRALVAGSDIQGGFIYAPTQFVNSLIKAVDNMVWIRQWATVMQVQGADSIGIPTIDNDPADADWTAEIKTGSEDTAMSFGGRTLTPHPLAKRIKISETLLRRAPNAEQLVIDRLAYKFGVTKEKAYLLGTGSRQPLGVFVASSQGISTARDVSTDNTTSAVTADGLINAKYALKGQYWPRAKWLFHRDGQKQIAKLKDTTNQYLWRESVRAGEPDTLLNLPIQMSEYVPNTFTTGQYVGILGDFSMYHIAQALGLTIKYLAELYAEYNQIGLIGREEEDGMPVLEEAFVRVKLG
ncbi:MAG: phage major capsid protein [Desulfurellales bacterium]|nr:MAG: phage major capsid protein [Desulfurellales bacterium]